MKEINGDLFELAKGGVLCLTTNGFVKKNGECVMGRGCALQAKKRWPSLPYTLGSSINRIGNMVAELSIPELTDYQAVVAFPVKHKWFEKADVELIKHSAWQLRAGAYTRGWQHVYVPRPGCGNGGLSWAQVKPVLEQPFDDDRFIIVDF